MADPTSQSIDFRFKNFNVPETYIAKDDALNRFMQNVKNTIESASKNIPFLDGSLVTVTVGSADTYDVTHGLNRKARGFFMLTAQQATATTTQDAPFWREDETNTTTHRAVYFAQAGTYQLWFW